MSAVQQAGRRTSIVQVAIASWIGTSIEWYDFFIYGTAAALVFPRLFFPTADPFTGLLASFATFWVGFGARPVGGIVFGHFGDRIGRKNMLILTLMLMGVATVLIGFLPTYDQIGVWAAVLLVTLRFIQGFAVGGEWGGAVLMATEHSPENRRGFYGSWPQMGVPVGVFLSNVIFTWLVSIMAAPGATAGLSADFLSYGWRIPFWLSAILIVVGLFIRLRISETPAFERVKESGEVVKRPLLEVLRTRWKTVLLAAGSFFLTNGSFYIFITFIISYGTVQLKLPSSVFLNAILAGSVISFFVLPLAGWLSDRYGRLPIYLGGAAFLLLLAFPMFWLIDTKDPLLIMLALCLGQFGLSCMYGPQAAFFTELFGANVRYSGASLGYQITSIFAGGLAPFIATILLRQSGGLSWPISVYLIIMAVITLVCTYLAGETRPVTAAQPKAATSGD